MEERQRVLFLSVHDSVRGQMAEGFLRSVAGDRFIATSGGVESGNELDPSDEIRAKINEFVEGVGANA